MIQTKKQRVPNSKHKPQFTKEQCSKKNTSHLLTQTGHIKHKKPSETYVSMIAKAMLAKGLQGMSLSDLYAKIEELFPYHKTSTITWHNAVRYNISINDCFIKARRASNCRGYYWTIHPSCVEIFKSGKYKRGDARRLLQNLSRTAMLDTSIRSPQNTQQNPAHISTFTRPTSLRPSVPYPYTQHTNCHTYTLAAPIQDSHPRMNRHYRNYHC